LLMMCWERLSMRDYWTEILSIFKDRCDLKKKKLKIIICCLGWIYILNVWMILLFFIVRKLTDGIFNSLVGCWLIRSWV
jgi:hypothetical protein